MRWVQTQDGRWFGFDGARWWLYWGGRLWPWPPPQQTQQQAAPTTTALQYASQMFQRLGVQQAQPIGELRPSVSPMEKATFGALWQFSRKEDPRRLSSIEAYWPDRLDTVYMDSWIGSYIIMAQEAGLYKVAGATSEQYASFALATIATFAGSAATAGPAGVAIGFVLALGKALWEALKAAGQAFEETARSQKANADIVGRIGPAPAILFDYLKHWGALMQAKKDTNTIAPLERELFEWFLFRHYVEFGILGVYQYRVSQARAAVGRDTLAFPPLGGEQLAAVRGWTLPAHPIGLLPPAFDPIEMLLGNEFNRLETRALVSYYTNQIGQAGYEPPINLEQTRPFARRAKGDPEKLHLLLASIGVQR